MMSSAVSPTETPEGQEAVFGLIARLADNKYFLGRRYAEWCSSAPTLEASVAAAAMAQDELGHARALYPVLRTLAPDAGPEVDPETRSHFHNLAFLDASFGGWPDFVAANFLIDTALTVVFAAGVASSFEPLAGRSRKVLQEERTHFMHGEAWVRRLAQAGERTRAALEESLERAWAETLCWFGPEGRGEALFDLRVLDAPPDTLRERFLARVGPPIAAARLALPLRAVKSAKRGTIWRLTTPLPWEQWDAETYRLATAAELAAQHIPTA
jgi:phenylacetate-CoA oxygenase PaaI subunit